MYHTLIRVDTVKVDNKSILGGVFSCAWAMLFVSFNLPATASAEDVYNASSMYPSDYIGNKLLKILSIIGDIPIPEIYQDKQDEYICLYKQTYFNKKKRLFSELSGLIKEVSCHKQVPLMLAYRRIKINEDIIVYEDDYQVVVNTPKLSFSDTLKFL